MNNLRLFRSASTAILTLFICVVAVSAHAVSAKGFVYHDTNANGQFDEGEKGLKGVGVSNGRDIVQTGRGGSYRIPMTDDSIVFVIKPSGWRTAQNENGINRFYYIHKPAGSQIEKPKFVGVAPTGPLPESINFPLYKQKESSTFKMICFGDTQPRNQEEVDYIAHDVVQELIGFDAAFGITLGDVVYNDLAMFEPLERAIGKIGVPWYPIHGNHDINFKSADDANSDETWERLYGPSYYSFDYGEVHFIAVDNIAWTGKKYHGELGEKQLAFIENDLALVEKDALVVVMMHIPITTVDDNKAFYALMDDRPNTFTVSAHWHRQAHYFLGQEEGWNGPEEHHHLVHATVCGSWWSGAKDENGIPHTTMADGAPNGYSIITFDDEDYTIRFKAARRPADHQMNIYAPEFIERATAQDTQVVVNVFAGSERSTVEMRVGDSGAWVPMTLTLMNDPYYEDTVAYEAQMDSKIRRKLPKVRESTHIWTGNLPAIAEAGLHMIHVRTTDMFGQRYRDERSIRVE